jgi:hypothetical protein
MEKKELLRELYARELAVRQFSYFVPYVFRKYVKEGFHEVFFQKLQGVADGKIKKLMVFLPPRSGKSEAIGKLLPAWFLGNNPTKEVVCASYGADLAFKHSRECKAITQEKEFINLFPEFKLADDKKTAGNWETKQGGGYYSIGVGGSLTGRGFDCGIIDDPCIEETQKVTTQRGLVEIKDVIIGDKVLTHKNRWRSVLSVSYKGEKKVIKIKTITNELLATPDHLMYTPNGWEESIKITQVYGKEMQTMWREIQCENEKDNFLFFKMFRDITKKSCDKLLNMWRIFLGYKECKEVLFGRVYEYFYSFRKRNNMQALWKYLFDKPASKKILFCKMHKEGLDRETRKENGESKGNYSENKRIPEFYRTTLQLLLEIIYTITRFKKVLFDVMQKQISFRANAWGRKCKLSSWYGISCRFSEYKKTCIKKGRKQMQGLWIFIESLCSSYRREQRKQFKGESCYPLLVMPCTISQIEGHDIARVYDIEVEEDNSFIVEGLVVHNCKNREEAESTTYREKVWDWYTSTFLTRRQGENSSIIVLMTRWHTDDLAGRLLELEGNEWDVLCLPAIDEQGEALVNNREGYGVQFYENMRKSIGVRDFEALYQQDPISGSGNIFKKEQFRYFALSDLNKNDYTIALHVDPAFSTRNDSDDMAIAVTAKHKITKEIYVLDVFGAALLPSQSFAYIISLAERWKNIGFNLEFISIEKVDLSKQQDEFLKGFDTYMRENGKFYTVLNFLPQGKGKKEDRIKFSIEPMFNRGAVYFRCDDTNDVWMKLEEQLLKFPVGRHDDLIDCISQGVIMWEGRGNNIDKQIERDQLEYLAYLNN